MVHMNIGSIEMLSMQVEGRCHSGQECDCRSRRRRLSGCLESSQDHVQRRVGLTVKITIRNIAKNYGMQCRYPTGRSTPYGFSLIALFALFALIALFALSAFSFVCQLFSS